MNEKKTGTNVPQQPTQPPMPPRGGSSAHRPAQTVKIGVETEGLDEATAKIEGSEKLRIQYLSVAGPDENDTGDQGSGGSGE